MSLPGAHMCLSPDLLGGLSLLGRDRPSFGIPLCLCSFTELNSVQITSVV